MKSFGFYEYTYPCLICGVRFVSCDSTEAFRAYGRHLVKEHPTPEGVRVLPPEPGFRSPFGVAPKAPEKTAAGAPATTPASTDNMTFKELVSGWAKDDE